MFSKINIIIINFFKKINIIIIKFLKKIHKNITSFFYLLYLTVDNPKIGYRILVKIYLKDLSFSKLFDFKSLISKLFSFKSLIFIYRIILYLNALFGAGIIIFYINPFEELFNNFIKFINYYNDNIFIIKFNEFLV
jgi:hypothetical protein